jgi:hypothetical protein
MLSVFSYCVTCGKTVSVKFLRTVYLRTAGGKEKIKVCQDCNAALQTPKGISETFKGLGSLNGV